MARKKIDPELLTPNGGLPSNLTYYRRYTIREVAPLLRLSATYLRDCLKAYSDEPFRRRRRLSRETLATLPLKHWRKLGGRWTIREGDLLRQM